MIQRDAFACDSTFGRADRISDRQALAARREYRKSESMTAPSISKIKRETGNGRREKKIAHKMALFGKVAPK